MNLLSRSLLFFICLGVAQLTYAKDYVGDPANVYCDCNPTISDGDTTTCTCGSSLTGDREWDLGAMATRGIHAHCTGISVYEDSGEDTGKDPTYQSSNIDAEDGVACTGGEIYVATKTASFSCTNWTIYKRSVDIKSVSCRSHE